MNDIQKSLRCTLVVRRPDTEELYVNWDPRISTLLHEATKIQQLGFDVPYMTQLLLNRAPLLLKKRDMVKVSDKHVKSLLCFLLYLKCNWKLKNQGWITVNAFLISIFFEWFTVLHYCVTVTKIESALPALRKFTSALLPKIK